MLTQLTHTRQVLHTPELPVRSRCRFVTNGLLKQAGVIHELELPLASGSIFFSAENLWVDRAVFREVFLRRCYATDYRGATVVDLGAHKGYYGAFALLHGARRVLSYEPEPQNYAFLARAAAAAHADWTVTEAAVTPESGSVRLCLSDEAWSHSLNRSAHTVGMLEVRAVSIADVLATVSSSRGRTIVKIDVEGLEPEVVRAADLTQWRAIDEIFVEVHEEEGRHLVGHHLEQAGFTLKSDFLNVLNWRNDCRSDDPE